MASDTSDDGQYKTADEIESDDEGQISFRNELTSSSESDDEVSGKKSMLGIFKFGKFTSSNNSGKEIDEFQVGKDQEKKGSEVIDGVKRQALESPSDQTGETALQPLDTDNSVKFVGGFPGRDSFDSTEDLKEQETDYMDIRDDSNMEADEKVDTAETMEEKETLRNNMNSSHMSPSHMEALEGNADKGFPQEANDTDMTYQMDNFLSINESFVILDPQSTSPVTVVVNNQMGETEMSFQEVTQIPSSEGFEESFEIVAESFDESGPIYENIENIKGTPPNSKDTNMTPLTNLGNPTKETLMNMSQSSSAEVQQESLKISPPPVAPKPPIRKQKQELNESQIQSILIMEDEAPKKIEEEQYLLEVEHKPMVRQPLEINDSAHESSHLEMEMVDIVKQEKDKSAAEGNSLQIEFSASSVIVYEENVTSKVDGVKQISEECIQFDDAKETADSEQRSQMDTKIDDIGHLSEYEKQIGDSVQQPQMESHVHNTEKRPQGNTYVNDVEERPQKYTQMDKAQERLLKDTQIEIAEKSPQDSKDDTEQRPQKDNQVDNTEHDASSQKVSGLMKMFECNSVVSDEDKTRKNADDGLHNIKSSPDENEPKTHASELPFKSTPVPKRCGNIVLKPKSVKQFNCEESQKEQSDVPESPLQPCKTKKDDHNESRFPNEMGLIQPPLPPKNQVITESLKPERLEDEAHEDSRPPTVPPPKGIAVMESLKHVRLEREMLESPELTYPPTPPPKSLAVMKMYKSETQKNNHNESTFPNETGLTLPPLPPNSQVITESMKPEMVEDEAHEDSRPPTPPPKGIAVMESLKHVRLEREMLESPQLTRPPTPPPKSLAVMKSYKPEAQPSVTSEPSAAQSTPPPPPKRFSDQSTNKSPQSMHSSPSGQLHDQQGPNLQTQQERHEQLTGSQGTTGHGKPRGSEGDVHMPSTSDGQQNLTPGANWSTGVNGQPTRQPGHPVQPPWGPQPWGQPHMSVGSHGLYAQYQQPWPSFYPGYDHQFPPGMHPPGMQHRGFPSMNAGGPFHRPPYCVSQEPPRGQTYKTTENQNQHFQQQQNQQQQQQQQQKHQHHQQQPRLHVPEGEVSSQAKHAESNRKQEEQQKEENKEIEKAKDEPEKTTLKPSKTSKTSGVPKASTDGKKNEDATAKRDKEKKNLTSLKQPDSRKSQDIGRQFQDGVGSSPQPALRKKEQKHGKGAKSAGTKSEEIASEPGYTMVIGLNKSTSVEDLRNFMEAKSGADLKEIVFGPGGENAVIIFERKPDHENLQNRVSKKPLGGRVLEVYEMSPPTSIIVSTQEPKEFSTDTLTFHFESKKYGCAELVEDEIKITEDGCYIMTFRDSNAVERVCAIQHKVENIPLNVSPYYQCKKWAAWNTTIHGINIPAPFAHQVDPVLLKYLQSFSRAMKAMQIAMVEMHAGIELQENAVLVTCLLKPEVKGCRKLVISWRKDAEENWNKFLSSTFQIEKITNMKDIWDDFIDLVKSMIDGKEIMLVEERFEDYIQLVGFIDEVKTTHREVMEKKEKLQRIRKVGKEMMPLKSAAKKRLLDRDGIFQRLRTQFSDFDVFYEQSSEEIVLSGVPEDRQSAKLQIFEELRKFEEPFVICDSTVHFSQFIKEGAPRNYLIKEMETNSLIVDWDVSIENGHVSVYCIPADTTQHAANLMKKMVWETNIPLSEEEQLFVTTEDWETYQVETESKCHGLVHIVVTNDNVIWISMEGIYAEILEDLKDFIKKNTVVESMIQCDPITKKFMQAFWEQEDYKEIEENSGDKHLQLIMKGDKLKVKGTKEGIQKARELWKEKTSKIIQKSHTLKRVGIKEVLMSEEQTGILKALEKEHRCLIQTENSDLPSHEGISGDVEIDEGERFYDTIDESMIVGTPRSGPYRCQNGLTISLTKGQLAQQKVDVIVCATSPDLNLNSGAASKSLVQRGGHSLQDECKIKYAEKIQEGQVVDINGGELLCDKVYLTALPDWKSSNNGQSLRNVVLQCLSQADGDAKGSIAFAAMGTGQLRYPHEDVASLMYDACVSYDIEHPQSLVKKVHFVLYEKDHVSIKAFEKEEKNMLCGGARPRSSTLAAQEHSFGNVKIYQVVEELAKQAVDAILCSCAGNLVLSQSGACKALLDVGGQSLQDECTNKYPSGIQPGEIAIIGGGKLKCKHVFLTVLPQYTENGEKALSDVITKALQMAVTNGCKSIAMPAMGTGYLRYPASTVAKTMYDAVGDYAKKNPQTVLTTVKFVLYIKDRSTQGAFEGYLKRSINRCSTRRDRRIAGHDFRMLQENKSGIKINPDDSGSLSCTVGKINVRAYTGDILDEKTDAIVNSVGGDFSFQGGVSNSLKKRCKGLEEKCKDKKYVERLRKDHVVVMDISGLTCKKIMHVKFQEYLTGWKKIFAKCLKKANKHKLVSLAFPVLGTGGGATVFEPNKIAEMFFEALVQFDEEHIGHRLQNINIVVFHKQPQFIPEIKKAMMKISHRGSRGTLGKMVDKVIDLGQGFMDIVLPRSGVVPHQPKPVASRSQMSIATIQVYSDLEKNIESCIFNLEQKLDKAYTSMCLTDELIAKMSKKELEEFFQTDLFVEWEFIPEEKQVLIKGAQKHVIQAQTVFHKKLMDKVRKDNEKRDAEQLYQVVQWQFEDVTEEGVNLVAYDELTNYQMEEAFKRGDVALELKDPTKKKVYIVDFKNYIECDKDDDEDTVKIVRKDILKDKASSLPDIWMEMKGDENIRLVNLQNQDAEYKTLETTFMTECQTGSYASRIPNAATLKVLKIQRIQNRTLYQQYAAKRQLMMQHYKDKKNIKVEWKAWHGTAEKNIESIYTHGFNRSYCGTHGVWFGQGVYFATNASYSARGWLAAGNQTPQPGTKQFIFYVSVCVGEYIKGDPKMRYLPAKDPNKPTDVYDSAVNDVNNVEEIVIFNDTQAYPDYLITFTT